MTKIWHIYPTKLGWQRHPTWDVVNAFVVYANTSNQARLVASTEAGAEGTELWINRRYSYCVWVGNTLHKESAKVLVKDFSSG